MAPPSPVERGPAVGPVFVRHGRSVTEADVPTHLWRLDPGGFAEIQALAAKLPSLPVVCSDMRRAIDTAEFFGVPTVDTRLAEVSRPFVDDLGDSFARYFAGEAVEGWEPQSQAVARIQASLEDHGEAIYVTHGTVLSLFLASQCPDVDGHRFWTQLGNPDAWSLRDSKAARLGGPTRSRTP